MSSSVMMRDIREKIDIVVFVSFWLIAAMSYGISYFIMKWGIKFMKGFSCLLLCS